MSLEPSSELPPLGQDLSASSNLGSLAQSARAKQLKTARGIMIVVGILTVGVNGVLFATTRQRVDHAIQEELKGPKARGFIVDQRILEESRQHAIVLNQVISGSATALGVVFVILGIMVYTYPVPVTVLGLVLYIGRAAVFGFIDPTLHWRKAWLIKIIIVVALVKSVQAAIAYQKG